MRHSFIAPRKKKILTQELKLVLFFFSMTLFVLFSTYGFLLYKTDDFSKRIVAIDSHVSDMNQTIAEMEREIAFIKKEAAHYSRVSTSNSVLKDSIKNLFDLVPDRITLTKAVLQKNALILYGVTPNKEVYEFLLQAPLRSIFHKNYSDFYPLENGWYRFVSTNYLDEEAL
jgi:cell division protein FtsB